MIRARASRSCRLGAAIALVVLPPAALAQGESAADSVVMVRCAVPGGVAKATGFVWPDRGRIVTALHAVAGCEEIEAWSEATRRSALGMIVRVDLEADLALVELADDLGLAPARQAEAPPNLNADHFTWGYPLAAEQMIRLRIEFGAGRASGVTTLGAAFSSDELEALYREQSYPTRETQIFRVNSTIQPGRSGAPIFDDQGKIVAIVDGGLLGGWRTINWSIPAHVYLPALLTSADRAPSQPSRQTLLHSSVTPDKSEAGEILSSVPYADAPGAANLPLEQAVTLDLVRQFGLGELGDMLASFEEEDGLAVFADLVALLGDPEDLDRYTYDVFEDSLTGATIGVPSDLELAWDEEIQAFVTANELGTVHYAARIGLAESFTEATEVHMSEFAEILLADLEWSEDDMTVKLDEIDEANETAVFHGLLAAHDPGSELDIGISLGLYVSGPVYLGVAVVTDLGAEDATEEGEIDILRMLLGAWYLTDFAVR